jgi:hypothetical protein
MAAGDVRDIGNIGDVGLQQPLTDEDVEAG